MASACALSCCSGLYGGEPADQDHHQPDPDRWGIRTVLIVNGLIASAFIAACALVTLRRRSCSAGRTGLRRRQPFDAIYGDHHVTFADVKPEQRQPAAVSRP